MQDYADKYLHIYILLKYEDIDMFSNVMRLNCNPLLLFKTTAWCY